MNDPKNPTGATDDPKPVLSIVIPSLEIDRELRRCIDSIRIVEPDQRRCEIVLVVPTKQLGSADELSADAKIVAETHKSIYGAMNDGARASSGRYLFFCGKDDILLPSLKETVDILATQSPSVLYHDVYWGSDGIYRGKPSRWRVLIQNLCHQGIIYSRSTFDRHGPYIRKMRVQSDHLLNIRIIWSKDPEDHKWQYRRTPLAWYSGTGLSSFARDPVFRKLYPATLRRYVGCWAAVSLRVVRWARGTLR